MKKFAIVFTVIALSISCGKKELTQEENQLEGSGSNILTQEDVAGKYENKNADPYKTKHMLLHGNGKVEEWEGTAKGSKESDHTKDWNWKVVEKEVHINVYKGDLLIFRVEPNGDLTKVALKSSNGKRLDIPDKAITKDSVWEKIK